jgi:hypothetical protein
MASAHEIALLRRAAKIETYRRDYLRFAREQQLIIDKDGVLRYFELFPTQQMVEYVMQEQYKEYGWIRIMEFKARQHGGSTHGVSRACHRVFLNENVSALILAQDDTTASNLFDMAGRMYDSMHPDIKPVRRYLTKQEIVLENPDVKTRSDFPGLRSRMAIQSAKNMHAGVGTTRTWLHISEMCRFGNVKELMGSLVPAIPLRPNTAIINESAPFGYGEGRDSFRASCDAAKAGKSPYRFVGIYWWMCPEYFLPLNHHDLLNGRFRQTLEERRLIRHVLEISRKELGREITLSDEQLKYRRVRIQELGQGDDAIGAILFQQQFPSDYEEGWVVFQNFVFPTYELEKMKREHERGPARRCDIIGDEVIDRQHDAPLWIWEDPQAGEMYDIGVDTAQGEGGNASAFQVFKRSNNEQVAEYRNNRIKPLDYAAVVYSVGLYYNAAHVAVEVEGIGYSVNEQLNQMGYPNIYRWRKRDHAGGGQLSPLTGWKTQFDTKGLLVAVAQHYFAHREVIVHSSRLYGEMRYFAQDFTEAGNEKYYPAEGDDDLVMSFMIAQVVRRDELGLEAPMSAGAKLDRIPTLAERNKRLQAGIEASLAFVDNREQSVRTDLNDTDVRAARDGQFKEAPVLAAGDDDPWEKFARAMQGKD